MVKQLLLIPFLSLLFLFSSPAPEFATDKTEFLTQLEAFVTKVNKPSTKEAFTAFKSNISSGTIDDAQVEQLAMLFNKMLAKKVPSHPSFEAVMGTVNQLMLLDENKSQKYFKNWYETADQLTEIIRPQKTTKFKQFVTFTEDFLKSGIMYESNVKNWYIDNAEEYDFLIEDKNAKINIKSGNIYATSKKDSLYILETSGTFSPSQFLWKGNKGKVTWTRGQDANFEKAYALLNTYDIDVKKGEYQAENVDLYHDELFKNPLKGRITDKLSAPQEGIFSFPRFESYKDDFRMKDLIPNITFQGGFGLYGNKIVFLDNDSTFQKARMEIKNDKGRTLMAANGPVIGIKNRQTVNAINTEVMLYFKNDSIYHPNLNVTYDATTQDLKAARNDNAISQIGFMSSFHKLEFELDVIKWNLADTILRIDQTTLMKEKPAYFNSYNYYNPSLFLKYRKAINKDPIAILGNWRQSTRSDEISIHDFAKQLRSNYTAEDVISIVYDLVDDGFIYYEINREMMIIRPKANLYNLARSKQTDYDNINIKTVSTRENLSLNLNTSDLQAIGVESVVLSDSQRVVMFPYDKVVNINENRTITSEGDLVAGRIDFIKGNQKFNYKKYTVDIDTTDKMLFYIGQQEQFRSQNITKVKPIKTALRDVRGTLFIDAPGNKAGLQRHPEYPIFEMTSSAYIYYDNPDLYGGAYAKDKFYFEIHPFTIDSLYNIPKEKMNFPGTMVFADIFPRTQVVAQLQEDYSLGTTFQPEENVSLYKGLGKFNGSFDLSNKGLRGNGRIDFLTSTFSSENLVFLPDSTISSDIDTITVRKDKLGNANFPAIENGNIELAWYPHKDSMVLKGGKRPFDMFEGRSSLKGNLILTSKGAEGRGEMLWNNSKLVSNDFTYDQHSIYSDLVNSMELKNSRDIVSVVSSDIVTNLNVYEEIAIFEPADTNIALEFPNHQYVTEADLFNWAYKDNKVTFQNKEANYFLTSTHPKQKDLRFKTKGGVLNLENDVLKVEKVPFIKVADVTIIPNNNLLSIEPDAIIQTLENAKIMADTTHGWHIFEDAVVDIYTRTDFAGSGNYQFKTSLIPEPQNIFFNKIETEQLTLETAELENKEDKKALKKAEKEAQKQGEELYHTIASGEISPEQHFKITPNIEFKGKVNLASDKKFLTFDGFSKVTFNNPRIQPEWFSFNSEINPENIQIDMNKPLDANKRDLYFGMMFSFEDLAPYPVFFNPKRAKTDFPLLEVKGLLDYNPKLNLYRIGPKEKLFENRKNGNVMALKDNDEQTVVGEGKINLGQNFGLVTVDAAGRMEYDLINNTLDLQEVVLGLDFMIDKKVHEAMVSDLKSLLAENDIVNFLSPGFSRGISELLPEGEGEKTLLHLAQNGFFSAPKGFEYPFFLCNINMKWDEDNVSFRSIGDFSLAYMSETYINRQINGYIEVAPRKNGGDYFHIYLVNEDIATGREVWYYFHYKNGIMQMLSSNPTFNQSIDAIKPNKRKKVAKGKGDEKGIDYSYQYILANMNQKNNFVYRMQESDKKMNPPLEEEE